jgi:hypothetical protein
MSGEGNIRRNDVCSRNKFALVCDESSPDVNCGKSICLLQFDSGEYLFCIGNLRQVIDIVLYETI